MSQEIRINVVNRYGWGKEFTLDKPIVQIGSDARNDIVLNDGTDSGVTARHAQLLPSPVNRGGMRLINLSTADIQLTPAGGAMGSTVGPRASAEVASGDEIKIGEFKLTFTGGEARSAVVLLRLETAGTQLTLDQPLSGTLTLNHVGNKAAVQFRVELEGLERECYEIGPGPVLFPNAEKQVAFRLRHSKKATPPAGPLRITFHVTAPDAYPNERASISHDIEIAPLYKHRMRVMVMESTDFSLG
jgi:hypothetical protein